MNVKELKDLLNAIKDDVDVYIVRGEEVLDIEKIFIGTVVENLDSDVSDEEVCLLFGVYIHELGTIELEPQDSIGEKE